LTKTQKKEVTKIAKKQVAIEQELKVFDSDLPQTGFDDNGAIYNLFTPTQGDAFNQITGLKVRNKYMEIRGLFSIGDVYNTVRMIIFRWHPDANVDAPQVNEILQDIGTVTAPFSPYSYQHRPEFTILKDKLYFGVNTQSNDIVGFHHKIKINHNTNFTAFGPPSVGTNGIFLLLISDSATAPHPYITMQCRIHFTDS